MSAILTIPDITLLVLVWEPKEYDLQTEADVLQEHHVQYCKGDKEVEAGVWVSC
jgi:hypothetical protein